jgi:hypothetical protein
MNSKRGAMQKQNQRTWLALGMIGAGLVIILGAVLWGMRGNSSNKPTPNVISEASQVPRASLEEAYRAYQQDEAVFIDVRSIDNYSIAHVKGAITIPENEVANRMSELPKNKWIIPYCT